MDFLVQFFQVLIPLGIINVWFFRFNQSTSWRGGKSNTLREEFEAYGLPYWFMILVGFLKISFAALLLLGLSLPWLTQPAAIGMAVLMCGAVSMHIKVRDPIFKSIPALCMLFMSLFIVFFN